MQELRPLVRSQSARVCLAICIGPSGGQRLRLVPPHVGIQLHKSERKVHCIAYLLDILAAMDVDKRWCHHMIKASDIGEEMDTTRADVTNCQRLSDTIRFGSWRANTKVHGHGSCSVRTARTRSLRPIAPDRERRACAIPPVTRSGPCE